ncbi:MAG TPA: GNAT family N-acetyltransferase [Acidobacteriaceae bacterium]
MPELVVIRPARLADATALAALCFALWPESPLEEHAREIEAILSGQARTTLPLVYLVADALNGTLAGFVETGLRSHADGCDTAQPVGFLEGWYVAPAFRRQGIGRRLIAAAEDWARAQSCQEMASDTWIDHELSQRAHTALGFQIVDRCIHFRKSL